MPAPTITAQTVASTTAATITVDTTGVAPGTYTVHDPSTGATATIQVVVNPFWWFEDNDLSGGMQTLGGM